jgi:hypothetical protein
METDIQVQQRVAVDLQIEPSDATAPVEVRVTVADVARSEENILRWRSYLHEDCVKTMISMGWDVTT